MLADMRRARHRHMGQDLRSNLRLSRIDLYPLLLRFTYTVYSTMAGPTSSATSRANRANRRAETKTAIESKPMALSQNEKVLNRIPLELWGSIFLHLLQIQQQPSLFNYRYRSSRNFPLNDLALTCSSLHSSVFSTRFSQLTLHDGLSHAVNLSEKIKFFQSNPAICQSIHLLIINFTSDAQSNEIDIKNQFNLLLPTLKSIRHLKIDDFAQSSIRRFRDTSPASGKVVSKRWDSIWNITVQTLKVLSISLHLSPHILKAAKNSPQLRLEKIEILVYEDRDTGLFGSSSDVTEKFEDSRVWNFYRTILGYSEKAETQDGTQDGKGQDGKAVEGKDENGKKGTLEFNFLDSQECGSLDALHLICRQTRLPILMKGNMEMCCDNAFYERQMVSLKIQVFTPRTCLSHPPFSPFSCTSLNLDSTELSCHGTISGIQ